MKQDWKSAPDTVCYLAMDADGARKWRRLPSIFRRNTGGKAMKPTWKDSPPQARYLAMDKDGCWTWFREEPQPHPELSIWTVQSHWAKHAGYGEPSDEWLSTKERRPEQCRVCGGYGHAMDGHGVVIDCPRCNVPEVYDETP